MLLAFIAASGLQLQEGVEGWPGWACFAGIRKPPNDSIAAAAAGKDFKLVTDYEKKAGTAQAD